MATGVTELLDMLFEMVDEAKNVPFTGDKCMLDRDRVLDLIDDIRTGFPVELETARKLVETRNDYLASAKREAEIIRKQAEGEAKRLVDEDVILLQIKQKSGAMMQEAEESARTAKINANRYCEDVLQRTEEALAAAHSEMSESRAKFRAAAGAPPVPPAYSGSRPIFDAAAVED